jgi:hypothetical protein
MIVYKIPAVAQVKKKVIQHLGSVVQHSSYSIHGLEILLLLPSFIQYHNFLMYLAITYLYQLQRPRVTFRSHMIQRIAIL